MMTDRCIPVRNQGPTGKRFRLVTGLNEHLEIESRLVVTGAMNRATFVTEISIMRDAVGYGYKTNRSECQIVIRTHDMLDYTPKAGAEQKHTKKVLAALKKFGLSAFDVDESFDHIIRLTGDAQAAQKYPHLFR